LEEGEAVVRSRPGGLVGSTAIVFDDPGCENPPQKVEELEVFWACRRRAAFTESSPQSL
jgi:hypothetical protein